MPSESEPHLVNKGHVAFCFDVLSAQYYSGGSTEAPFKPFVSALFVTWNKKEHGGRERLRGCIGTLEPKAVPKALRDYALTSALHDRRFAPISAEELPLLSCTVSFLHSFEQAANWSDWVVGVHGLIIKFKDPKSRVKRTATFLPEVAHSEGWEVLETLEHLILKAGYQGSAKEVLSHLEVTRYQSSAASLTYKDYCAMRSNFQPENSSASISAVPVPA